MSTRNILLGSGVGGVILWGRDMSFSTTIFRKLKGVHVGFLRQVTGQTAKLQRDGIWISVAVDSVPKETRAQTLGMFIDKQYETVAEWVTLRPIIEVRNKDMDYKGGGRRREP